MRCGRETIARQPRVTHLSVLAFAANRAAQRDAQLTRFMENARAYRASMYLNTSNADRVAVNLFGNRVSLVNPEEKIL